MEKETHKKYVERVKAMKNAPKTMVDLSEVAQNSKRHERFKSMESIAEEDNDKPILTRGDTFGGGHRRNRSNQIKSKTVINGGTTSLNSLGNVDSGTYNSIPDNVNPVTLPQIAAHSDEDLADSALLREDGFGVDEELLRHLRKFPKIYFVGDTLKIKYSRTIGSGNYFGRRAINKKSLSKQVIVADEECHCIVLHKDDYLMALEAEKNLHRDKINFFKQMFPQIDPELVTEFSLLWDKDSYKRSDVIYQEKDSSNRLFVVFEGEIIISKEVTEYMKSKLQSEGKKKDSFTFQVATLCQGYFFGEEFFKRKPREFSVTASSSKAKVLQLSLKDYKLLGRKYFEIFSNIQEMVQLSYKLNVELLENLYQAHGVEVSRQAVHQDYMNNKEQLSKAESTQARKDVSTGPKQFVKASKKPKNVNIRLQYDRYFVCKPGQKHPEYLKVMFNNKKKTENSETKNETLLVSKRRSSSLEGVVDLPAEQQNFNFVKHPPSSMKKVPSQLYMTQSRSEETRENTTNEGSIFTTTLRTRPAEEEVYIPTPKKATKVHPKSTRSVSFIPAGSLDSIYSENEQIEIKEEDHEEELLVNTSEMIPLDLQNVRASCGSGNESEYMRKGVRSLENSLQSKLLRSTDRNNTARLGEFNPIMISVASSNVYSNNVSITPKTSLNKHMPHTQRGMFSNVARSMTNIPSFSNVASVTARSIVFDKEKPSGTVHLPAINRPQKKSVGSMKDLNELKNGVVSYSKVGKVANHRKLVITKGK